MVSELVVSPVRATSSLSSLRVADEKKAKTAFERYFSDLKPQQAVMVREVLEFIIDGHQYMGRIDGRAGVGKSYCVGRIVQALIDMSVVQNIVVCAPTHQAVAVAGGYLGGLKIPKGTLHRMMGLRAKRVNFLLADQRKLDLLVSQADDLSEEEEKELRDLRSKQMAASQRMKRFEPSGKIPTEIVNAELLIVSECGMVSQQLWDLLGRLRDLPGMQKRDPKIGPLQILFEGDLAQLAPVGEIESLTGKVKSFSPLTEPVRYDGKILEYAHMVLNSDDYMMAHYRIPEDDTFLRMSEPEVLDSVGDLLKDGTDIRFLASSNKRVDELNAKVRFALNGEEGLKRFYPGDRMLTRTAIERGNSPHYLIASGGMNSVIQIGTSTLLNLKDQIKPGDWACLGWKFGEPLSFEQAIKGTDKEVPVVENLFQYTSVLGTTYHRQLFTYSMAGESDAAVGVVMLLDPIQKVQYDEEVALLYKLAQSSHSSSNKTTRGSNGKYSQQVFDRLRMKNWFKWADGSNISEFQFKEIRKQLWKDYFALHDFVDDITLAFASTVHKIQGGSAECIVIDGKTILQNRRYKDDTWDPKKVLYTAATRAREQLVFML